jgi:2-oxoglutarate ferredoxin oxidoreductase subunit alpha
MRAPVTRKSPGRTNDFVVKFANVNGSGSASANLLFARSILGMGVPVAARNIFPSNIQGLPTWYEVRVSGDGWVGRRGGADLMVAMNPQTWDQDMGEIEQGGYLFYDCSRPIPAARFRPDVERLGLPLTEICNAKYDNPRERQLLKNIVYVGALAELLGIELDVVEGLIGKQYKGKDKLIGPNVEALHMGAEAAGKMLPPIGLKVERADKVGDRIFVEGNKAAGLGAVYGGATVCAWYPITPSTSLAEAFEGWCGKLRKEPETGRSRYAIVQAEDEIASIGMVVGAGWNGARAFTCTSGPGISLMQEFIGLSYFAEIPAVIFDVQRGGPSTGMPTRTQQADLLVCAYASHGDTKHPLLFPEDPRECFELGAEAFDLADRLQTTVFVLLDLDIGMNEWLCEPFAWDDSKKLDRGKVMTAEALEAGTPFGRYDDVDGDGIPWRTLPGTHPRLGAYTTRGTSHDRYARYSEQARDYVEKMDRLSKKFDTARTLVPAPVRLDARRPTETGVIYFGSTSAPMAEALEVMARQGVHVDALRVRAFPFSDAVYDFIAEHETVFVVEQNRDAQLKTLIVNEGGIDPTRLTSILHYEGAPITARFIIAEILAHVRTQLAAIKEPAQ